MAHPRSAAFGWVSPVFRESVSRRGSREEWAMLRSPAPRMTRTSFIFPTATPRCPGSLCALLGEGGFDAARDIEAITVNRWPRGYAYEYAYFGEPEWTNENKPCIVGKKPFGRFTIANSDAGGEAYLDGAIDQAYRAVSELREPSD